MAQDKNLNELLKWSIENSTPSDPAAPNPQPAQKTELNPEVLASLFGGPSDAELMQASMAAITSRDPDVTLEAKLTAFDNLEQLVESLDNANLLAKLGLWTPLLDQLGHAHPDMRLMAAWCVGTAVQNNEACQERLVALGGVERLVAMALGERAAGGNGQEGAATTAATAAHDASAKTNGGEAGNGKETKDVRKKAVYALSSAVRNYQPAMDVCMSELRKKGEDVENIDAMNMDAVDSVINGLKEKATNA